MKWKVVYGKLDCEALALLFNVYSLNPLAFNKNDLAHCIVLTKSRIHECSEFISTKASRQ